MAGSPAGRLSIVAWSAAALAALPGCSTYRERPLDRAAVDAALQAPPPERVRAAAADLKHPLVRPLAIDGRDGYTPDEVAVMAVVSSPELRALRDQRGVAEAQVIQAGILPNPQIAYSIDRPHGNDDPTLVPAKSLGLSWDVTSLLTRGDQVAGARAGARALDLSVAWQEWQAAQDARLRAFRILSLEERLPLARIIEGNLAATLELTREAVKLGHRTAPDLTQAADAWTQAQGARYDIEQQLVSERAALRLALGLPPGAPLVLKASPAFPELPADTTSAEALLEGLEDRRLDLVALRFGYESQEASLRAAVKAQFPKIGLTIDKARDTTPVYTRGFGATIDIPIFDRNQGQVAIGEATRRQLFDEYVARVAEARSQVGQILAALQAARAQLRAAEASLPDLESLVGSLSRAAEARNADVLSLRDAQDALATREIDCSQLRQGALELGVALEIATGRPLLNLSK
jgi:outer membrane protein TolC